LLGSWFASAKVSAPDPTMPSVRAKMMALMNPRSLETTVPEARITLALPTPPEAVAELTQ